MKNYSIKIKCSTSSRITNLGSYLFWNFSPFSFLAPSKFSEVLETRMFVVYLTGVSRIGKTRRKNSFIEVIQDKRQKERKKRKMLFFTGFIGFCTNWQRILINCLSAGFSNLSPSTWFDPVVTSSTVFLLYFFLEESCMTNSFSSSTPDSNRWLRFENIFQTYFPLTNCLEFPKIISK